MKLKDAFKDLKDTKLPNLPGKSFFRSKTDPKLLDERKKDLQVWLDKLLRLEEVRRSAVFKQWIEENDDVGLPPDH